MTYTLHKLSMPGWVEEFDTKEALAERLSGCVCGACWQEETDQMNTNDVNDVIATLLFTSCGCEFTVNPSLLKEIGITTNYSRED